MNTTQLKQIQIEVRKINEREKTLNLVRQMKKKPSGRRFFDLGNDLP